MTPIEVATFLAKDVLSIFAYVEDEDARREVALMLQLEGAELVRFPSVSGPAITGYVTVADNVLTLLVGSLHVTSYTELTAKDVLGIDRAIVYWAQEPTAPDKYMDGITLLAGAVPVHPMERSEV